MFAHKALLGVALATVAVGSACAADIGASPLVREDVSNWFVEGGVAAYAIQFPAMNFGRNMSTFPISNGVDRGRFGPGSQYGAGVGLDATIGYRLLNFAAPTEIYAKVSYLRAGTPDSLPSNVAMVPFIDGIIRPGISGGGVVGLFGSSGITIDRSQQRIGLDLGFRQTYNMGGYTLTPGLFVGYQAINNRDRIAATGSDPQTMNLRSDVDGHYWRFGASLGASVPIIQQISLFGNGSVSLDLLSANLNASQSFTGTFFPPPTNVASASDRLTRTTWRATGELGVLYTSQSAWSLRVSALAEYVGAVPNPVYPTFIAGSRAVSGSTRLSTDSQFNLGGRVAVAYKF